MSVSWMLRLTCVIYVIFYEKGGIRTFCPSRGLREKKKKKKKKKKEKKKKKKKKRKKRKKKEKKKKKKEIKW